MEEIQRMTKPILFVEGKSDELIIKKAWDLYSGTKMPFKIEECSGTSKMKSLACDGTALQRIAARKLFIFVDNDKECRELYVNGKLGKEGGKWATHNSNKSRWCRLPWHDEFSETMKTLKLQESNWPLSIENMFDYAVRKAALEEGAYKYSEKPHNELLSELGKISTIYRAADDCREYMYIMDIDFNYKISFAEWICKKATVENQFLLNFVGLVESLKEELNRKDS